MTPDVVSTVPMDNDRIEVGFDNGRRGIVDISDYVRQGDVLQGKEKAAPQEISG